MYDVLYGYFIVIIALDAIPSFEKKKMFASQKCFEFLIQSDRLDASIRRKAFRLT